MRPENLIYSLKEKGGNWSGRTAKEIRRRSSSRKSNLRSRSEGGFNPSTFWGGLTFEPEGGCAVPGDLKKKAPL